MMTKISGIILVLARKLIAQMLRSYNFTLYNSRDMGVNLRCKYRGMPQKLLDAANINRLFQQQRREIMPNRIQRNSGRNFGKFRVFPQDYPHGLFG